MHSAHVLAAAGGDGLLEVDANPNPLRTRVIDPATGIFEGNLHMVDAPGIGIESPVDDLSEFVTMPRVVHIARPCLARMVHLARLRLT